MTKQNKRKTVDKDWYNSKARPKIFNIAVERTVNGGYRVLRGDIMNMVNQWEVIPQRVDVRDLVQDIKNKGIFTK